MATIVEGARVERRTVAESSHGMSMKPQIYSSSNPNHRPSFSPAKHMSTPLPVATLAPVPLILHMWRPVFNHWIFYWFHAISFPSFSMYIPVRISPILVMDTHIMLYALEYERWTWLRSVRCTSSSFRPCICAWAHFLESQWCLLRHNLRSHVYKADRQEHARNRRKKQLA